MDRNADAVPILPWWDRIFRSKMISTWKVVLARLKVDRDVIDGVNTKIDILDVLVNNVLTDQFTLDG
eukprot:9391018-Karenia_brevis.AAC.1